MYLYSNFSIYNIDADLKITPEITDKKEVKKTIISEEVIKNNKLPIICSQRQMGNAISYGIKSWIPSSFFDSLLSGFTR